MILILHLIDRLDRKVAKTFNTCPDAGCVIIHQRVIEKFTCFTEVKAEYKKKDTLSTHQDLLRLSLFGINEIEDRNAECILLIQVIGKVNPKSYYIFHILFINVYIRC